TCTRPSLETLYVCSMSCSTRLPVVTIEAGVRHACGSRMSTELSRLMTSGFFVPSSPPEGSDAPGLHALSATAPVRTRAADATIRRRCGITVGCLQWVGPGVDDVGGRVTAVGCGDPASLGRARSGSIGPGDKLRDGPFVTQHERDAPARAESGP